MDTPEELETIDPNNPPEGYEGPLPTGVEDVPPEEI